MSCLRWGLGGPHGTTRRTAGPARRRLTGKICATLRAEWPRLPSPDTIGSAEDHATDPRHLRVPQGPGAARTSEQSSKEDMVRCCSIIHQVCELWFKQVLHEGDLLKRRSVGRQGQRAFATLKEWAVLKTSLQIDILETMTPISFLSFRTFCRQRRADSIGTIRIRVRSATSGSRPRHTEDRWS